jgi:hypothetical protein
VTLKTLLARWTNKIANFCLATHCGHITQYEVFCQ